MFSFSGKFSPVPEGSPRNYQLLNISSRIIFCYVLPSSQTIFAISFVIWVIVRQQPAIMISLHGYLVS